MRARAASIALVMAGLAPGMATLAPVMVALAPLTACGGGGTRAATPATPTPTPAGPAAGGGATGEPGGAAVTATGPAAAEPVTRDECARLVDKLLAISMVELAARDPRMVQPTAEQQAALRAHMLTEAEPMCATMSRDHWQCAMDAGDRAGMTLCDAHADAQH